MIATATEKKEYFEAMQVETESNGSYANQLRNKKADDEFEFKSQLIKSQWSYVKKQLDANENPRTLLERGDLYLLRDNYKRAISYYQKSLVQNEDYLPAYEKIIEAYCSHNKHPEAHVYYKQLLKLTGNREDIFRKYVLYRVDLLFLHGGDIKETLGVITQGLQINSEDCELLNTYGFIKLNFEQNIEEAEEYFDRVLEVDANYIHAVNNKGICQLRTERLDDAELSFQRCIDINPKFYPFSYQNLSFLYVNQDKLEEAYNVLQRANENGAVLDNARKHLEGWLLIQLERFEEAVPWYENMIMVEPNNQLLLNNLGFAYVSLGMRDMAKRRFQEAVNISEEKIRKYNKLDKRALKAYYNLARIANSRKDFDEIKRLSDRIFQINKDDAFGFYLKGVLLNNDENYEQAKLHYLKSLKLDHTIHEVYPDLAFILSSIDNDYRAAIELLERAVSYGYTGALIVNNLVFAYIKNENLNEAEEIIERLKTKGDLPPVLKATNGLLEMRKGNIKQGNSLYESAIEEFSDDKNKMIAGQIKAVENARYYIKSNEYNKARDFLTEAKTFPESYVNKEIKVLEAELNLN